DHRDARLLGKKGDVRARSHGTITFPQTDERVPMVEGIEHRQIQADHLAAGEMLEEVGHGPAVTEGPAHEDDRRVVPGVRLFPYHAAFERRGQRDVVSAAGASEPSAGEITRHQIACGRAHLVEAEPSGHQCSFHGRISSNEQSVISSRSTASRIRGSHNTSSSCTRSAEYIVSRSPSMAG